MARRAIIDALILNQACRISLSRTSIRSSRYEYKIIRNIKNFCSGRRTDQEINCTHDKNVSSNSHLITEKMQDPPPETNMQTMSDARKTEGNDGQTTSMVFGSTVIDGSTGEWLTLDEKVNTYPSARRFTAIGLAGDDFVQSMVTAVESVIQHPVPKGYVKQRVSSGGKYVSVNIGPVRVISKEQVQAVYNAMRSDNRMKFFL